MDHHAPKRERIPPDVQEVDVSSRWPGKPPFFSRRVTSPATVRALVTLFDSLPIVQPGAISCPAESVSPTVALRFLGGTTPRLLALASVSADASFSWPADVPGWACFPIQFNALGHPWTPLVGNAITPIQRLLHVKLAARPTPLPSMMAQ
jgi:hypothetical protein